MSAVEPLFRRTPAKRKARELATTLRRERADYVYLKEVFRQLRGPVQGPAGLFGACALSCSIRWWRTAGLVARQKTPLVYWSRR